jgi:hypothetical protein
LVDPTKVEEVTSPVLVHWSSDEQDLAKGEALGKGLAEAARARRPR